MAEGDPAAAELVLRVPALHAGAVHVTVSSMLARVGQPVAAGTPLCELRVDLAEGKDLDCPPFFHSRLVSSEAGSVREICARDGDTVHVGAVLLALAPAHPIRGTSRALRIQQYRVVADPFAF